MKILVVCQYYKPEPFRIADICENLVSRGHEVSVITGVPNYPEGVIYQGYEHGQKRDEVIGGVSIHRCFTVPRKTGVLNRFLNYYSFAVSSSRYARSKKCVSRDGSPFDVVLVNLLSPVMMASAAVAYKKKHGTPLFMYCLDLWPESLTAGGIRKGSLIYKVFARISRRLYRAMDAIAVTSRSFIERLQQGSDIPKERLSYLPQYAEALFAPCPKDATDTVDLMFAGNVGAAQSVDTILDAAALLKEEFPQLRWHIVGSGSEHTRLQQKAQPLGDTVMFHGRKPLDTMPSLYAQADAMLVTLQADEFSSMTLPGKVQSYMAAGKPLLGAINGETAAVIADAQCGFCGAAEDAAALADNVRRFMATEDKTALGANARAYYEQHFSQDGFMQTLEEKLREMIV